MSLKINRLYKDKFLREIIEARQSKNKREKFIEKYFPFIIKTITKTTGNYVEIENDIYLSIGLETFNEAIEKYNDQKGKFLTYAEILIKNKIIDEMRKNQKRSKNTESLEVILLNKKSPKEFIEGSPSDLTNRMIKKEEIKIFKEKLSNHKITLQDLLIESPKHKDTRVNCYRISKIIEKDSICSKAIWENAKFLRNRIVQLAKVTEKIIKGNRKFIIATSIILIGQLTTFIEFLDIEGGAENV